MFFLIFIYYDLHSRRIVAYFSLFLTRYTPDLFPILIVVWLFCDFVIVVFLTLDLSTGISTSTHIVRPRCSAASEMVIDHYRGVIDDTNATACRGDIREAVGWIWGGWGPLFIWMLPAMVAGYIDRWGCMMVDVCVDYACVS